MDKKRKAWGLPYVTYTACAVVVLAINLFEPDFKAHWLAFAFLILAAVERAHATTMNALMLFAEQLDRKNDDRG